MATEQNYKTVPSLSWRVLPISNNAQYTRMIMKKKKLKTYLIKNEITMSCWDHSLLLIKRPDKSKFISLSRYAKRRGIGYFPHYTVPLLYKKNIIIGLIMRFRPGILRVLLVMARGNVFVKINFSWRCV